LYTQLLDNILLCCICGRPGGFLPCSLPKQNCYTLNWSSCWMCWRYSRCSM